MNYYEESLKLHELHKGKIEVISKVEIKSRDDLI
jgi:malate dehydrogenase (oxaloacetate-decarboxylating)